MAVRVVFADDNYLVREGVRGLLDEVPGIDLVETVADPDALHRAVVLNRPDAVLTDIRMPPTFTTARCSASGSAPVSKMDLGHLGQPAGDPLAHE